MLSPSMRSPLHITIQNRFRCSPWCCTLGTQTPAKMSFTGINDETSHAAQTTITFFKALICYLTSVMPQLNLLHFVSVPLSSQFRNKTVGNKECGGVRKQSRSSEAAATCHLHQQGGHRTIKRYSGWLEIASSAWHHEGTYHDAKQWQDVRSRPPLF